MVVEGLDPIILVISTAIVAETFLATTAISNGVGPYC